MIIKYTHGDSVDFEKTSVALGTFDGVHIAHMSIIKKAKEIGIKKGLKCGVLTFDTIPANIITGATVPQIMDLSHKIKMFEDMDFVYVEKFDEAFMNMSPKDFVLYLKDTIKASAISVGYNYHFGKNGVGTAEFLKSLCEKENISVYICDKSELDGAPISSTRVRSLISTGNVHDAARLLGRPFSISGVVTHGKENGTKMGFPTANIIPDPQIVSVKDGVYAGFCTIDDFTYKAVINVGNNPTFDGKIKTIECHFLDFCADVYGREMNVQFISRIRDEINFNTPEALVQQISKDIEFAKIHLG